MSRVGFRLIRPFSDVAAPARYRVLSGLGITAKSMRKTGLWASRSRFARRAWRTSSFTLKFQPGANNKAKEHFTLEESDDEGFILGSPTIDHYRDTVVNHRTGDRCVHSYKPRKDAFEITGHVVNARGHVACDIAERWNSQLVAMPRGRANGTLHPDMLIPPTMGSSSSLPPPAFQSRLS